LCLVFGQGPIFAQEVSDCDGLLTKAASTLSGRSAQGLIEKLRKPGQLDELLKADPEDDHSELLVALFQGGLDQFKEKIGQNTKLQEAFDFISGRFHQAKTDKTMSLVFYNAASDFLVRRYVAGINPAYGFGQSSDEQFSHFLNFHRQGGGVGFGRTYVPLYVFVDLSFYDILELWPEVLPIGVDFRPLIHYDQGKGNALEFANHDAFHATLFLDEYRKLSKEERQMMKKAIHYLREIRPKLTDREEKIVGDYFGWIVHEQYGLRFFLDFFYADQVDLRSNSTFENLWRRLRDEGLKVDNQESMSVLLKVRQNFRGN
jgi:hypothetical protein